MGRIVRPSNRTPGWSRRKSPSVADRVTFKQNDVNGLLRYFGHGAGDTGPFFEGPEIRKAHARCGSIATGSSGQQVRPCRLSVSAIGLGLPDEIEMQKMADNDNSFIVQRLQEGGWRVIHRQADLTDVPIADFVSHREADEWVKWKSGQPKINPYEVPTRPKLLEVSTGRHSRRFNARFPVDVKVTLIGGAHHDVDFSALAFEIAASAAFREALHKTGSVLLEPITRVEVVGPADCIASVASDLNLRRGQIQGQDMRGNATVIKAMVPLMNMSGFANNLRSMSQGRATFTMYFDHYAPTPTPSSTN
jgi:hypothetical protein